MMMSFKGNVMTHMEYLTPGPYMHVVENDISNLVSNLVVNISDFSSYFFIMNRAWVVKSSSYKLNPNVKVGMD